MFGNRVEITYSDGKVYKECFVEGETDTETKVISYRKTDGCVSLYRHNKSQDNVDENWPLVAYKTYSNGEQSKKHYYPSMDMYILFDIKNRGADLSNYDLFPGIKHWVGVGEYEGTNDGSFELFFDVENNDQLIKLCDYYGVKFPLPKTENIDKSPRDWHSTDFHQFIKNVGVNIDNTMINDFKIGSIVFKNNAPEMVKMYKSNI